MSRTTENSVARLTNGIWDVRIVGRRADVFNTSTGDHASTWDHTDRADHAAVVRHYADHGYRFDDRSEPVVALTDGRYEILIGHGLVDMIDTLSGRSVGRFALTRNAGTLANEYVAAGYTIVSEAV